MSDNKTFRVLALAERWKDQRDKQTRFCMSMSDADLVFQEIERLKKLTSNGSTGGDQAVSDASLPPKDGTVIVAKAAFYPRVFWNPAVGQWVLCDTLTVDGLSYIEPENWSRDD